MVHINIKNKSSIFIISLMIVSTTGCKEYTPKPKGYNRIDAVKDQEVEYDFTKFSFKYSDQIHIDTLQSEEKNEIWFNIVYPKYNAVIYCTYLPISKLSLPKVLDDSYRMAFSHTLKADEIVQKTYSNIEGKVSGTVYSISGSVATPIQFFLTDSINHFFRGSFYYSEKVNADSVAPITEFVLKDIQEMISTFVWRDESFVIKR